jgi:hypothetical protein
VQLGAGELDAARRPRVGRHGPGDLDDALLAGQVAAVADDLRQPGAVSDDEEGHGFQQPAAMDPAGDRHSLAGVLGELRRQDTRDHHSSS